MVIEKTQGMKISEKITGTVAQTLLIGEHKRQLGRRSQALLFLKLPLKSFRTLPPFSHLFTQTQSKTKGGGEWDVWPCVLCLAA